MVCLPIPPLRHGVERSIALAEPSVQTSESGLAGATGGLGSAVSLAKAQWVANGETGQVDNLAGFGDDTVDVSPEGWPQSTSGDNSADSAADCMQVWNGVMQNPPPVATDTSQDYQATTVTVGGDLVCRFTYTQDSGTTRRIDYNTVTGAVTALNPRP